MLRRSQRKSSASIIYEADIVGTARIVYDEKAKKLQGVLTDKNDKCFSLRGYVVPEEKQQSTIVSANINLLDSETNHDFKFDDVIMKLDIDPETKHRRMILEHLSLKFVTERWYRGYRADVEISEHIDPRIVGYGCGLFVGNMTISTISTHCFVPLKTKIKPVNDSYRRIVQRLSGLNIPIVQTNNHVSTRYR